MSVPPQAFVNKNKKHFLGIPAPLGYVAGVGRGQVFVYVLFYKYISNVNNVFNVMLNFIFSVVYYLCVKIVVVY